MYRQYRESIPIGYAGTAIDKEYSLSRAHPSKDSGVFCSAPDTKIPLSGQTVCEEHFEDPPFSSDEHFECEIKENSCNECDKREKNPCEKPKSEDLLSKLFGEKFSLEDLIFVGILILLAFGKADDEIMLIIGLLLLISF